VFVEFAYEADLKKFAELPEIPKFRDEEMIYMTKDAYVRMKAKEKGIDESEINKGGQGRKGLNKFNAFREMAKMKHGQAPQLAKIPSGVDVVGKAVAVDSGRERGVKRGRDDGEEREARKPKVSSFRRNIAIRMC
jgi:lupus La protein